jgi:hypothetical protein
MRLSRSHEPSGRRHSATPTSPFCINIALLHHDDSGLSFEALEHSAATQPQEEIEAAFNDLFAELLLILTRLLGRVMAQCLAADRAVKAIRCR